MAKRFTDSRKWQDDWFIDLDKDYKLFWIYLLDTCDHIGLYKPALSLANFCLKTNLTEEGIFKIFGNRIIKIENGKWFIPKFIKFQYGQLSADSAFHLKMIKELGSLKLLNLVDRVSTGYQQGIDTLKDKDKDKAKDKDKVIKGGAGGKFVVPSLEAVETYCQERKNSVDPQKWHDWYTANGWKVGKNPMKDWRAAVRTWERKEAIGAAESNLTKAQRSNLAGLKKTMERRNKNDGQEFSGGLPGVSGGLPRLTIQQ